MNVKKRLVSVLIAAMLLAIACIPVSAETATAESDAGVDFTEGGGPEIIDPPTDPDDPLKGVSSRNIHFGEKTLSDKAEIYKSLENNHDDLLDDKRIGVSVSNTNRNTPWQVDVQITGFFIGENQTMEDFRLLLKPDGDLMTNNGNTNQPVRDENGIALSAGTGGVDGETRTILKSHEDGTTGQWGGNWFGELTVPAGSADEGNAKAVMKWKISVPVQVD